MDDLIDDWPLTGALVLKTKKTYMEEQKTKYNKQNGPIKTA